MALGERNKADNEHTRRQKKNGILGSDIQMLVTVRISVELQMFCHDEISGPRANVDHLNWHPEGALPFGLNRWSGAGGLTTAMKVCSMDWHTKSWIGNEKYSHLYAGSIPSWF